MNTISILARTRFKSGRSTTPRRKSLRWIVPSVLVGVVLYRSWFTFWRSDRDAVLYTFHGAEAAARNGDERDFASYLAPDADTGGCHVSLIQATFYAADRLVNLEASVSLNGNWAETGCEEVLLRRTPGWLPVFFGLQHRWNITRL